MNLPENIQPLKQLTIIGVGLIGGSFALDLKRAGLVEKIVGVGRTPENLARALQLGVIHEAQPVNEAVAEADLVLVATPVGQMGDIFTAIDAYAKPDCIITDAGSTKVEVVAHYRAYLAKRLAYCVPAHPIAGTEQSGAAAARYGLYQNRNVVLCALPETLPASTARVAELWQACGAKIYPLAAQAHDDVFATVSHLPHLLAFSYMNMLAEKPNTEDCLRLAASGFRDFTRIAASSPEMWRDIALNNREALLLEIAAYQKALQGMAAALQAEDEAQLAALMQEAQQMRSRWDSA